MNTQRDKVLVVEDEGGEVAAEALEHHGFDVRLAQDGRAAVEMAEAWSPDIVLLDIQLPVMDGFEVIEELRRRQVPTRVVMYSGHRVGTTTAVRCIRAGACDYFEKGTLDSSEEAARLRRYVLLESTMIGRVSDPAPIVDKLIAREKLLEAQLVEMTARYKKALSQQRRSDLGSKATYVALSLLSTFVLSRLVAVTSTVGVGGFFLALVALLFLPTDRLRDISAKILKFNARVKLD
jgi:CheY-like chemotaxis protein